MGSVQGYEIVSLMYDKSSSLDGLMKTGYTVYYPFEDVWRDLLARLGRESRLCPVSVDPARTVKVGCVLALRRSRTLRRELKEMFDMHMYISLVRALGAAISEGEEVFGQKSQEALFTFLWSAQRQTNPALVPPQTAEADDLVEALEKNKEFFQKGHFDVLASD